MHRRPAKEKVAQYDQRYHLDGVVDTVCLMVADIRHRGRAKSNHIIEALASQDALGNLHQGQAGGVVRRV